MAKRSAKPPITQENKTIIDMRELGVSGLRRFSGFVLDDFMQQLLQWRGIDVYTEMAYNDADIGAVLNGIRMMARRVAWNVKPATIQPFDQKAGKWLESCLDDMESTWLDVVDEILFNVLPFGHAPEEVTYKRRAGESENPSYNSKFSDGRIGWRKFEIRHPNTIWKWEFSEHGDILGLWQLAPPRYQHVYIPIQKLALFRTTKTKNNPEGFSILRNAYRAWYLKKNIENIEGIGVERDLAGLPVAYVPPSLLSPNASPQEKATLAVIQRMIINIRRDEQEGIVFPLAYDANGKELYKLDLLSAPGQRQFDTDKVINRYRQSIMMNTFADFLLLGHNAGGNRSIVEKRSSMFAMAIGSFLDIISDVMNRTKIPQLFRLNPDIQISDYPKLTHGEIDDADLDSLGNYFLRLSQTGMPLWPNPELQKHLMQAARAPTPTEPMRLAEEMEVQPRRNAATDTVEIPADPIQEPTGGPASDIPTPGIPPVNPGEPYVPITPYPIPPSTRL